MSRRHPAGMWPVTLITLIAPAPGAAADGRAVADLTGARVLVAPDAKGPAAAAVDLLVNEVAERSRVAWRRSPALLDGDGPLIVVAREGELDRLAVPPAARPDAPAPGVPEGYRLALEREMGRPVVWVVGHDDRGVLFGVGRLLRSLRMGRDRVTLPEGLCIATAPRYRLRGHQLGYRPKTNSYDAWTVARWDRYIGDLAAFGCNAIELIPPRSDDEADSPHFPLPPLRMMAEQARIADRYGLDVWVWFPALDADYTDPATVDAAVREWGEVFRALPRVDAVFVPGGDPGGTPPRALFGLLERQAANLRASHPKATMWLSPQGFDAADFEEFLALLRREPGWLAGVVFGPQVRMDLPALRAAVPARYPIRFYPDITHSRTCQYPVPGWDRAFALTEGREVINPRPLDQAAILRRLGPLTCGFLTYSEGCNDDVNKAVWSALGWDPDADVVEVLREYARYYIDAAMAEDFAQGLLALERNWRGPVATNAGIETTLAQFLAMERAAGPRVRLNWRFQQALYRAVYDAYLRRRLLDELALEGRAFGALRRAPSTGSLAAMARAEAILARADDDPAAPELRARAGELAEALFQSIGIQLDVGRYAGQPGRGTSQEAIDRPLNDAPWLRAQFAAIRALPDEADRLARLAAIASRIDPGPGGFYDDLGDVARQPHLVRGPGFDEDPAGRRSALMHFDGERGMPASWHDQALTLYEQPLRLEYEGLDPAARYRVRVVYGLGPVRLTANGEEVHPPLDRRYQAVEFDVPARATATGRLRLEWTGQEGRGGNGRAVSVAEVFLLRVRGPD